ncbi:MAG: DUF3465 domain-containing protein [Candidatus Thiodiazotropha sp.]|jgi:hypothetical protein
MKQTKRLAQFIVLGLFLAAGYYGFLGGEGPTVATIRNDTIARTSTGTQVPEASERLLQQAFENRQSNLQVRIAGRVSKLLPDDRDGSRHQRFVLRLASGQTLLVAHNIDLAPRVEGLEVDDRIELFGEYEWNQRGGVIHWTHHDPRGSHEDGWIRYRGRLYQ